jgi:hypothetical protein
MSMGGVGGDRSPMDIQQQQKLQGITQAVDKLTVGDAKLNSVDRRVASIMDRVFSAIRESANELLKTLQNKLSSFLKNPSAESLAEVKKVNSAIKETVLGNIPHQSASLAKTAAPPETPREHTVRQEIDKRERAVMMAKSGIEGSISNIQTYGSTDSKLTELKEKISDALDKKLITKEEANAYNSKAVPTEAVQVSEKPIGVLSSSPEPEVTGNVGDFDDDTKNPGFWSDRN